MVYYFVRSLAPLMRIRKRTPDDRMVSYVSIKISIGIVNEILQPHFLPWYRGIGGADAEVLVVKDGSHIPRQGSYSTKWKRNNNMLTLKWVGNSSDLNPVENL